MASRHELSPEQVELVEQSTRDARRLLRAVADADPEDVPGIVAEVLS